MYKSFTADQYRKHLNFPEGYKVDAMLCYGTLYEDRTLAQLEKILDSMKEKTEIKDMPDPFLRFAKQIKIDDKTIWFAIGYGGAWLSEYIHWACLFGSKKNILLGSCGGLKSGIKTGEFIVPTSSFAEESSARIYNRESNIHKSDQDLSQALSERLAEDGTRVWQGPMVTCQAMIGETKEDVDTWTSQGYYGVEMEASTVFAVSGHFGVPAAASLYVGDNLIENQTNMDEEYVAEADIREQNQMKQIRIALAELLA